MQQVGDPPGLGVATLYRSREAMRKCSLGIGISPSGQWIHERASLLAPPRTRLRVRGSI